MKLLSIITLVFFLFSFQAKTKIKIKASETYEIPTEDKLTTYLKIHNTSVQIIDVKVIDPVTNTKIRSFSLNGLGKANVKVEPNYKLSISNTSKQKIAINIEIVKKKVENPDQKIRSTYIKFTLHNSTNKSIPLIIPGVMNPNLSPNSDSGVSLKIGQKVFYKKNGRSKLLFVVDDNIKSNDVLDVAKLISAAELADK